MFKQTQKKAADLAKDLRREIQMLEAELNDKKHLLETLSQMERKTPFLGRKKPGPKPRGTVTMGRSPVARKVVHTQRKSKNRDIVTDAAGKLGSKFSLAELKNEILKKYPKFGGDYASGTILAVLKNTPQIKKVKRGTYTYKAKK